MHAYTDTTNTSYTPYNTVTSLWTLTDVIIKAYQQNKAED